MKRKKLRKLEERKRNLLIDQESLEALLDKGEENLESDHNINVCDDNDDDHRNKENNLNQNLDKANKQENTAANAEHTNNSKSNNKDKSKSNSNIKTLLNKSTKAETLAKIEQELLNVITEINRINEEDAFAKQKRLSQMNKEEITRRKQEEFKLNCEKAYADERQRALARKKLLEDREKDRLENLEKTRIKKIKKNAKLKKLHMQRFEVTQNMLEKKLEEQYRWLYCLCKEVYP